MLVSARCFLPVIILYALLFFVFMHFYMSKATKDLGSSLRACKSDWVDCMAKLDAYKADNYDLVIQNMELKDQVAKEHSKCQSLMSKKQDLESSLRACSSDGVDKEAKLDQCKRENYNLKLSNEELKITLKRKDGVIDWVKGKIRKSGMDEEDVPLTELDVVNAEVTEQSKATADFLQYVYAATVHGELQAKEGKD